MKSKRNPQKNGLLRRSLPNACCQPPRRRYVHGRASKRGGRKGNGSKPVMPSAEATKVQGPPGPRMHWPGETGSGVGMLEMPPQIRAALRTGGDFNRD